MNENILLCSIGSSEINFTKGVITGYEGKFYWAFPDKSYISEYWNNLKTGDIILFGSNKVIHHIATIKKVFKDFNLSQKIWIDSKGAPTREYPLFVEIEKILSTKIQDTEFKKLLSYKPKGNLLQKAKFYSLNSQHTKLILKFLHNKVKLNEEDIAVSLSNDNDFNLKDKYQQSRDPMYFDWAKKIKGLKAYDAETKKYRETKCLVCPISNPRLLVASHIKPWSKSNQKEKYDINNGITLCQLHDKMFEDGAIVFQPNSYLDCIKVINDYSKYNFKQEIQKIKLPSSYNEAKVMKYMEYRLKAFKPNMDY